MGISRTRHGLSPFECISAIQKGIRRSDEELAFRFVCEMVQTSKAFCTWVCNRLEVICHEDCDTMACPILVPLVGTCIEQAKRHTKGTEGSEMWLGTAVRAMCRAPKSRENDHFIIAVGLDVKQNGPGEIPDFALDVHTRRGQALGRGAEHWTQEASKLIQPPTPVIGTLRPAGEIGHPDPWKDRADAAWKAFHGDGTDPKDGENGKLFD